MKNKIIASIALASATALLMPAQAGAADADAAQALARKSGCFKCHGIDKTKKGPAYTKIALKYKGKEGADEVLFRHVTTGPKIKFDDGTEEQHMIIDTQDDGAIKNLIAWILSLKG